MATIRTMNFDHLVGEQVGTSVLLKKLDHGSMSVVFVAYQKTLKRQIAGVIPHDSHAFVKAINSGQPSFATNPTSKSSLAIATLARDLSAKEMDGQKMNGKEIFNSPGLLEGVFRLAQAV